MIDYTDPGDQPKGKRHTSRGRRGGKTAALESAASLFEAEGGTVIRTGESLKRTSTGTISPDGDITLKEGQWRKEEALDDHEEHKKEAIKWLRKQLANLYKTRSVVSETVAFVTADDARRIYDASRFPKEYSANHTFFGSIFRGNDWHATGHRVPSLHPANNARSIMCWRYVG